MSQYIYIDSLTPRQFEELVAQIFQRLYPSSKVVVTRFSNDYGVDVKVIGPSNVIYIQCKYYNSKGTVGRPVVQKLHSIMVADNVTEGAVVTTGKFSKSAIDYANKLFEKFNIKIHLIDRDSLKVLSSKVGIILLDENDEEILSFMPWSSQEMKQFVKSKIKSYPIFIDYLVRAFVYTVEAIPLIYVRAFVNKDCTTSTGRIIHSTRVDKPILFVLDNGKKYEKYLSRNLPQVLGIVFSDSSNLRKFYSIYPPDTVKKILSSYANVKLRDVVSIIKENISKKYTKMVTYRGRNNVRYRKLCEIRPKDVKIQETLKLVVPIFDITLRTLKSNHRILGISRERKLPLILHTTLPSENLDDLRFCNACGEIIHKSESIVCAGCGAIVCKNDSIKYDNQEYCDVCYEKLGFKERDEKIARKYNYSLSRLNLAMALSFIPGFNLMLLKKKSLRFVGVILLFLMLFLFAEYPMYTLQAWGSFGVVSFLGALLERHRVKNALNNLDTFNRLEQISLLRKAPVDMIDKKWRWYKK